MPAAFLKDATRLHLDDPSISMRSRSMPTGDTVTPSYPLQDHKILATALHPAVTMLWVREHRMETIVSRTP